MQITAVRIVTLSLHWQVLPSSSCNALGMDLAFFQTPAPGWQMSLPLRARACASLLGKYRASRPSGGGILEKKYLYFERLKVEKVQFIISKR